jgi:hypothetical protein
MSQDERDAVMPDSKKDVATVGRRVEDLERKVPALAKLVAEVLWRFAQTVQQRQRDPFASARGRLAFALGRRERTAIRRQ